MADSLTDAKRRLIERLKRVDAATATELAEPLGITDTAVRQHLEALEASSLVERAPGPTTGRGRPPVVWRLTELARDLFPDRHAELTLELIGAIRTAVGDDGLDRVLDARTAGQRDAYRRALPGRGSVPARVRRLAEIRSAEGYLAEVVPGPAGSVVLVEHHCPIGDAAYACSGLCARELSLFRDVLGDDVVVERTSHLVSGDQRCAYSIRRA